MQQVNEIWKKSGMKLPGTSKGVARLVRSLTYRKPAVCPLENEPRWDTAYVQLVERGERVTMCELGYTEREIRRWNSVQDNAAIIGPFRILTEDGSLVLARICRELERSADHNDYVVTQRLRSVECYSRFIRDMIRNGAKVPGRLPFRADPNRDLRFLGDLGRRDRDNTARQVAEVLEDRIRKWWTGFEEHIRAIPEGDRIRLRWERAVDLVLVRPATAVLSEIRGNMK